MPNRYRGNTLTEYGFIAAIILVGCIAAVTVLGGNITGAMKNLKGDIASHANSAGTAGSNGGGNPGGGASNGGYPSQVTIGQSTYDMPAPPQSSTATTGTNGSDMTASQADYIRSIAQRLQDQGADPTMVEALTDLANKGHALANLQNSAEGMCYNAVACTDTLASVTPGYQDLMAKWNAIQPQLSGLSPELASVVGGQIDQMSTTNNSYASETAVLNMMYSGQQGSTTTTGNSNNVCTAGGGTGCTQTAPGNTSRPPSQTTGTLGR